MLPGEPRALPNVLQDMETVTTPHANGSKTDYDRLREAYDRAFHELSQALETNADVAPAERQYHETRDALFRHLMNRAHEDEHPAIERLAYTIWERAGRPDGTAESDWYSAEALLATN